MRQRQQPMADTGSFQQPTRDCAEVKSNLKCRHDEVGSRSKCERSRGNEKREQKEGHCIAHYFVRKQLDRIEAAAQWLHDRSMSPEIRLRLRNHADAHSEFILCATIGLFSADRS